VGEESDVAAAEAVESSADDAESVFTDEFGESKGASTADEHGSDLAAEDSYLVTAGAEVFDAAEVAPAEAIGDALAQADRVGTVDDAQDGLEDLGSGLFEGVEG
jgi:hypothetical protein